MSDSKWIWFLGENHRESVYNQTSENNGIWSLEEVNLKQENNDWDLISNSVIFNSADPYLIEPVSEYSKNFGYIGGGSESGMRPGWKLTTSPSSTFEGSYEPLTFGLNDREFSISTIFRIDYSNDDGIPLINSNLTIKRSKTATVSTNKYAYFAGGANAFTIATGFYNYHKQDYNFFSSIERLDYVNDTVVLNTRGSLDRAKCDFTAAGNDTHAVFLGGKIPNNYSVTTYVDGNNQDDTRFVNGCSTIVRMDYSNDTTIVSNSTLNVNVFNNFSGSSSISQTDKCFIYGGILTPSSSRWQTSLQTYAFIFSSETLTSGPNLARVFGEGQGAGGGSFSTYYFSGLYNSSAYTGTSIDYEDSFFNLSTNRGLSAQRHNMSNDSVTVINNAGLSLTRYSSYLAATGNSLYGYIVGGQESTLNTTINDISRVNLANSTGTNTYTTLPRGIHSGNGVSAANFNVPYYFAGNFPRFNNLLPNSYGSSAGELRDYLGNKLRTSNAGYFAGGIIGQLGPNSYTAFPSVDVGRIPYSTSHVETIDFSNDTAIPKIRGSLTQGCFSQASASSESNGYFTGGYERTGFSVGSQHSITQRVSFFNDSSTLVSKAPLNTARDSHSGVGNSNYGYFGGGRTTTTILSSVERIQYSSDTTSLSTRGSLGESAFDLTSTGNSSYAWFFGGLSDEVFSRNIFRINYSSDTNTASSRAPLSYRTGGAAATSNGNYGYIAGGHITRGRALNFYDHVGSPYVPNKIFSSEWPECPTPGANAYNLAVQSSTTTYNVFVPSTAVPLRGEGYDIPKSNIQRIDFSNDTILTSPISYLMVPRSKVAGTGNQSYGYYGGGRTASYEATSRNLMGPIVLVESGWTHTAGTIYWAEQYSSLERLDYSNDTVICENLGGLTTTYSSRSATSAQDNGLPVISYNYSYNITIPTQVSSSPSSYGYFVGGHKYGNYSTFFQQTSVFSSSRSNHVAGDNYIRGNYYFNDKVERYDFSSDTSGSITRCRMDEASSVSASSSNTCGYFSGGHNHSFTYRSVILVRQSFVSPVIYSSIRKLNYSNDTALLRPKLFNNKSISYAGSTGNINYGWIIGGSEYTFSFGNFGETPTYSWAYSGTGGIYGTETVLNSVTNVSRINYSNDTVTASAPISTAVSHGASYGNKDFGYVSGGTNNYNGLNQREQKSVSYVVYSSTQRIDFANDSTSPLIRGSLPQNIQQGAGHGNATYGYISGGVDGDGVYTITGKSMGSTVYRVSYANDSVLASTRGNLSNIRGGSGATGNQNYGYISGGRTTEIVYNEVVSQWNTTSSIERIDYSNDTATATLRSYTNGFDYQKSCEGSVGESAAAKENSVSLIATYPYSATTSPINNPLFPNTFSKNQFGFFSGFHDASFNTDWFMRRSIVRLNYANDLLLNTFTNFGSYSKHNFNTTITDHCRARYRCDVQWGHTSTSTNWYRVNTTLISSDGVNSYDVFEYGTSTRFVENSVINSNFLFTYSVGGEATFLSNENYGYVTGASVSATRLSPFASGFTMMSNIGRIDYHDVDQGTVLHRATLPIGRTNAAGHGNQTYGYISGGQEQITNSTNWSTVSSTNRLTYSTDTMSIVSRAVLTHAAGNTQETVYGAGNQTYGIVITPSNIQRMSYSDDTIAYSQRVSSLPTQVIQPNTVIRRAVKAHGNATKLYIYWNANQVERDNNGSVYGYLATYSYSNDTLTRLTHASIDDTIQYFGNAEEVGMTGNANYTWLSGGSLGRIDHSNDTAFRSANLSKYACKDGFSPAANNGPQ